MKIAIIIVCVTLLVISFLVGMGILMGDKYEKRR